MPAALRDVVDGWLAAGKPKQPATVWPRQRWIAEFPEHSQFIRAPFVEPLGLGQLSRANPPFSLVGHLHGRPWICCMHPGGAQRRGWPAREYAGLIVDQAQALA